MAKVRHMPAAFANQANGGSANTTASTSGSSTTGQQKPSPHQGQFFRIPKVSQTSSSPQSGGSGGGGGGPTQPSFEDILGSGDNVMRSPKSNKISKHSDSNRSPKKEEAKSRNHEPNNKEKSQSADSGVTITKLSVGNGGSSSGGSGSDKDNRTAARTDERREKESSNNHHHHHQQQHREKHSAEKSRDHHDDKTPTSGSRLDRDKKEYRSKEKENHRSHHAGDRDRSRDDREERRDRGSGVSERHQREDSRKPLDSPRKDFDIRKKDDEKIHERRKSTDSCKSIKDKKPKDSEPRVRKENSTSSSTGTLNSPNGKSTKQARLEASPNSDSSSLMAPAIPGLTITPVATTPSPAPAPKHSPDLQKLLSNLGTNIIPISEESKSSSTGLVIQPVASTAPLAPSNATALSSVKSSPKAAATAPTSPAAAAFDSSLFFKLPAPVEINNAQLKQPNGAGFFKLPPGTTKYIEENKQRKMQPAPATPPQTLKTPTSVDAAALVMATALQNAVLQKMKEPLNGLTLNDLIKSGLVSQTTASEKQAEALKKTDDVKQREKLKRKVEIAPVQTIQVEQVKRKCPVPAFNSTPDWTPLDLMVLTERMKRSIPGQDNIQFAVTESRMDWSQVAFGKYSSSECKSKWSELSQKVRQFRTLSELLSDTQELIKTSTPGSISATSTSSSTAMPTSNAKEHKKVKHPDLPKKPLTPYMRYLVDKLKIVKERYPELSHGEASKQITEKWHSLSEEKRQRLKQAFDSEMVDYQRKLEQFHRDHPEASPNKATIVPVATLKADAVDSVKSSEALKSLPPMDLSSLPNRIKEYVESALEKMAQSANPPAEKPPNNGYALFAKICQIDLETANLTFKETMSEMVKRWQVLTEDHRNVLNDSAKTIRSSYDQKFGRLNHSKVNVDKEGNVVVSAMPVEDKKPKKSLQTIPIPMEKLSPSENQDNASNEITPIELYKKEKFARLKEDYPDKPDYEILRVLSKTYMELPQEERLVWREKAKMLNEEQRQKENPKPKEKDRTKRTPRLPKRKPLPGEPKRPLMSGYSVFTNEVMSKLRENNQPKVLISVVAKQWTALPPEKKAEYKAKAAELDRKYKEEVNNFLKTLNPTQMAEYKAHLEATSKRRGRREERPEKRGLSEDSEDIEDEVVLNKDADEESLSESDMELRHSSAADCTSSEDEGPPPADITSSNPSSNRQKRPATDESSDEEQPEAPPPKAALPSMPCLTDTALEEAPVTDHAPEPVVAAGPPAAQTQHQSSSENSSSDSSDSDDSDDSSDDSSDESDSD